MLLTNTKIGKIMALVPSLLTFSQSCRQTARQVVASHRKARNKVCECGSGLKFKKCCLK